MTDTMKIVLNLDEMTLGDDEKLELARESGRGTTKTILDVYWRFVRSADGEMLSETDAKNALRQLTARQFSELLRPNALKKTSVEP